MRERLRYPAFRIPLVYLVVALPWVLLTDLLVRWASPSVEVENVLASIKGAGFVLTTSALLTVLIGRALRRVEEARDRALASEARFRALIASFDDVVFTTDADQRITDMIVARGSEQDLARAIGRTAVELFGEDAGLPPMELGERALAGESVVLDWFAETAPPIFPVSEDVTSLRFILGPLRNPDGAVIGTIGVGRDTSRVHDLERQHKQFESRISFLQSYDSLTGLPGRTLLESRLAEAIAVADRDHGDVGVFTLNLDDFKDINDSLGYEVGDQVLQAVARRLATVVDQQHTLARLSGDEFAIVRPVPADRDAVEEYVHEVLSVFETPIAAAGQNIYVSSGLGIAIYPRPAGRVPPVAWCRHRSSSRSPSAPASLMTSDAPSASAPTAGSWRRTRPASRTSRSRSTSRPTTSAAAPLIASLPRRTSLVSTRSTSSSSSPRAP